MTCFMKLGKYGLLCVGLIAASSCGDPTSSNPTPTSNDTGSNISALTVTSLKDGVTQFNTKVAQAKFGVSSAPAVLSPSSLLQPATTASMDATLWTTGGLRDWVNTDADPTNSLNTWHKKSYIVCILAIISDGITRDTDGIHPQDGTYSIPITQTMSDTSVTLCGTGGLQSMVGGDFPLTISTPTDTTYYKKNFTVGFLGSDSYMFGFTSSAIRFAFSEVNHTVSMNSTSYTMGNRSVGVMTPDGEIAFEYEYSMAAAGGKASSGLMRFAHSDTQDLTKEYSYFYSNGGGSDSIFSYTIVGKPTEGGTIALVFNASNMTATGVNDGSAVSMTDAAMCLTPGTWDIDTNNSISCGATGVSAADTDTAVGSLVATTFPEMKQADYVPSETAHLTWGIADTFTATPVDN